jgi:hypothetical protein
VLVTVKTDAGPFLLGSSSSLQRVLEAVLEASRFVWEDGASHGHGHLLFLTEEIVRSFSRRRRARTPI